MYLKLRTQYSFRYAYGTIPEVLDCLESPQYAGICDRNGTWGHREWQRECEKRNIKPIYGVELAVVNDMELREKQPVNWMSFVAINNDGLKEIYELVSLATEKFYYHPRIDLSILTTISNNVAILSGDNFFVIQPVLEQLIQAHNFYIENDLELPPRFQSNKIKYINTCNNLYPTSNDECAYQISVGNNYDMSLQDHHITKTYYNKNSYNTLLAQQCKVTLPQANMVKPQTSMSLAQLCNKLIDPSIKTNPIYHDRLKYELSIIEQKDFEDYFLIVYDLVSYARKHMLVGPARGSSCGSLVCYILGITTVDPIKFNLLFERFIDINRDDLPDIDIDFPDDQRDSILLYLKTKYGYDNVAKLGTLSYFKPKSALLDTAKALEVELKHIDELKPHLYKDDEYIKTNTVLKESFANEYHCKYFLNRFPYMKYAAQLEGRVRHSGVHAAGIVVTQEPLSHYCSIDERAQAIQVDKHDAEKMGLLKIDVLGLRTLSVLNDVLKSIGKDYNYLYNLPLNDKSTYDYINSHKFAGVFQFEGNSLQKITCKMNLDNFEDIVALTSLCRPGPMNSGGTRKYLACRTNKQKPVYFNDIHKNITENTFGVIVYQEQVMQIARQIGFMSWKDVANLRRAVAKSKGESFLSTFYDVFSIGAKVNKFSDDQINQIWRDIKTMGAYAFNRSHAVAYAMISYWCFYLKNKYPLEFACATLRHAKDEDQTKVFLRELDKENIPFSIYDPNLSGIDWQVIQGQLIGSLTNIKGLGLKTAHEIIRKRREGVDLTQRQIDLLIKGETPYDNLFETREKWGHLKINPNKYNIRTPITDINDIQKDSKENYLIIGKIIDIEQRQIDSTENVEKRGGKIIGGPQDYLKLIVHDDSGKITVLLGSHLFEPMGRQLFSNHKEGDYYMIYGLSCYGFRTLNVKKIKKLTGNPNYENI